MRSVNDDDDDDGKTLLKKATSASRPNDREELEKREKRHFKANEKPGQNGKFTRGMVNNIQMRRDKHDKESVEFWELQEKGDFEHEDAEREWTEQEFVDDSPAFRDLPNREKLRVQRIKKRSDPNIAPDEPVPLRLRPWDVHPSESEKMTVRYAYRNALGTVGECKLEIAKQLDVPYELVELINAGRKLGSDESTFFDLQILANYVVYFRIKKRFLPGAEAEKMRKEAFKDKNAPTTEGVACWQYYQTIVKQ
jgi:hypothetical protein